MTTRGKSGADAVPASTVQVLARIGFHMLRRRSDVKARAQLVKDETRNSVVEGSELDAQRYPSAHSYAERTSNIRESSALQDGSISHVWHTVIASPARSSSIRCR